MAEQGEDQKPLQNARVVVIPVDHSKHSEAAFDCEFKVGRTWL